MPLLNPRTKIPGKYQPKGFFILYEDDDIIVGEKSPGFLTVSAAWDKGQNIYYGLNGYVRKGNSRSHKRVFVVHRLDQHTSGLLIFAKNEHAQTRLKDDWRNTKKIYYAVVHGRLAQKSGMFESYLLEDEDYVVRSIEDSVEGKLAKTVYTVLKETSRFSLVKIDLLTGRKNQIRVHFSENSHPLVGDAKYGPQTTRFSRLALHAQSISFTHPTSGERITFETTIPAYLLDLVGA